MVFPIRLLLLAAVGLAVLGGLAALLVYLLTRRPGGRDNGKG